MPRKAREHQLTRSIIFHAVNRGVLRQDIFHDAADYRYFLDTAQRYTQRFQCSVYHWCLMPNHYHFVVEFPRPATISKLIGGCQQVYAYYHHKKYRTAGRLFQSRFKSQAIDRQEYLLCCGRYVELNPVRARLSPAAWEWQWSSARFYTQREKDGLTSVDPEWAGRSAQEYREWLSDTEQADKERAVFGGNDNIIGSSQFRQGLILEGGHAKLKHRARPRKNP